MHNLSPILDDGLRNLLSCSLPLAHGGSGGTLQRRDSSSLNQKESRHVVNEKRIGGGGAHLLMQQSTHEGSTKIYLPGWHSGKEEDEKEGERESDFSSSSFDAAIMASGLGICKHQESTQEGAAI